jgi:hypothetical protein
MALSSTDKKLVEAAFQFGPAGLIERGLSSSDIEEFLARPEVRSMLHLLEREFNNQEVLDAASKFISRRKLSRLSPRAIEILEHTLEGPEYVRNSDGSLALDESGRPRIRRPTPTKAQFSAARDILDRVGLAPTSKDRINTGVNVSVLLKSGGSDIIEVENEERQSKLTAEERATSRERVRNVIDELLRDKDIKKLIANRGNLGLDDTDGKKEKKDTS